MRYIDFVTVTDRATEAENRTATWANRSLVDIVFTEDDQPSWWTAVPQLSLGQLGGEWKAPTPAVRGMTLRIGFVDPAAAMGFTAAQIILPDTASRIMGVLRRVLKSSLAAYLYGDTIVAISKAAAEFGPADKAAVTLTLADFEDVEPGPQTKPLWGGQAAAGVSAALSTCKMLLAGATARAARPAPTGDARCRPRL